MPVLLENRRQAPRVTTPWARDFCRRLLEALGYPRAVLSVTLCGDAEIQEVNRQWRQRDRPTDVLSFSQVEGEGVSALGELPQQRGRRARPELLGDIMISLDTAARQAQSYRHSLEVEVARLLIHGAAHLLGHDHVHGGAEEQKMHALELRLMRALKVPLRP